MHLEQCRDNAISDEDCGDGCFDNAMSVEPQSQVTVF